LGKLGFLGLTVAAEDGGTGLGYLAHTVAMEEISRASAAVGLSYGAHSNLCVNQLALNGTAEQKRRYLPKLISGEHVGALAMSEPSAGSDVVSMQLKAHKRGDRYVLDGRKMWITNGPEADVLVVYAKTNPEAAARGISAFIIEAGFAGFRPAQKLDKLGMRGSSTSELVFDACEVPAENLLGEENHGFKLAMMTLDRTRPGVAAMATGIARAAFEFATDYAKERVQFGVPIAMHQAIQFIIADMATEIEAARLLTWKSAFMLDNGERNTLVSSHAKRFAADTAMKVATEAVQVYGGYGFIKEYPVEKLFRDAKIMQLYEGTSQIQRLVIARETLLPRRVQASSPEPAAAIA